MRVGVDTLFLDGRVESSLAHFVVGFVHAMVKESKKHQLVLFSSSTTARLFDRLPRGSVEIVPCLFSNENRVARIVYQQSRLPGLLTRNGVDVLCCLADVAPLRANVPVVLKVNTLHHYTAPKAIGAVRTIYRRAMVRASARRARLVIANSRPTATDIERMLGVPPERIRLIPEAVDDYFSPCYDQMELRAVLRHRFGISTEYLLFVSALYPYKNLDSLLRAEALLLAGKRWNGDLIVVGSDPYRKRSDYENLAKRLGIADRVRFLGPVDNRSLRELYCGASVFVYPSAYETFGKPILEAMRCAAPIVATNRGSIPDVANGAAVLIEPNDPNAIADAVARLLRDVHLRTRLREIGLVNGSKFSWSNVAMDFTKALEEATT